jgi:CheY-like chemotaxis protein
MTLPLADALLLIGLVGACATLLLTDLADLRGRRLGLRRPVAARTEPAPVPPAAAPRAPARRTAVSPLPPAADLLLVDDSAVARAKLRRLFEGAGYRVHLAVDGVEALALLAQGRYAMMVTDLEMPRMDGVALIGTCLAQAATARMPIIAVSAHENLRARFNACRDICGVHRKPWADDILLSHVAALIGTRTVPALATC